MTRYQRGGLLYAILVVTWTLTMICVALFGSDLQKLVPATIVVFVGMGAIGTFLE